MIFYYCSHFNYKKKIQLFYIQKKILLHLFSLKNGTAKTIESFVC